MTELDPPGGDPAAPLAEAPLAEAPLAEAPLTAAELAVVAEAAALKVADTQYSFPYSRLDHRAAWARVAPLLAARGITQVDLDFDGAGDSGVVEPPQFWRERPPRPEFRFPSFDTVDWDPGEALAALLTDIADSALPGGWEINEGGHGAVTLLVDPGAGHPIEVDYNAHEAEYEDDDEEYEDDDEEYEDDEDREADYD